MIRVGGACAVASIAEPRGTVPFEVCRGPAEMDLHLKGYGSATRVTCASR